MKAKYVAVLPYAVAYCAANAYGLMFAGILGALQIEVGTDLSLLAWLPAAYLISCALLGPFLLFAASHIPALRGLFPPLIVMIVSAALPAMVSADTGVLIFAAALGGAGAGMIIPRALAYAAADEDAQKAIGIVYAGQLVSILIIVPAATWLAYFVEWQVSYVFMALLLGVAFATLLRAKSGAPAVRYTVATVKHSLNRRLAACYGIMFFLYFGVLAVANFIGPIINILLPGQPIFVVLGQAAFAVGGIATIVVLSRHRVTTRIVQLLSGALGTLFVITAGLAAVGSLAAGLSPNNAAIVVLMGVMLFCSGSAYFAAQTLTTKVIGELSPKQGAFAFSFSTTATLLGAAAGTLFAGTVLGAFGLPTFALLVSTAYLFAIALTVFLRGSGRQPSATNADAELHPSARQAAPSTERVT